VTHRKISRLTPGSTTSRPLPFPKTPVSGQRLFNPLLQLALNEARIISSHRHFRPDGRPFDPYSYQYPETVANAGAWFVMIDHNWTPKSLGSWAYHIGNLADFMVRTLKQFPNI
jgi:hypothetical protein